MGRVTGRGIIITGGGSGIGEGFAKAFAKDGAKDGSAARAEAWLAAAAQSLEPGKPIAAQLAARIDELPGAKLQNWMAEDRKSTRLNSSHMSESRMPSSA